ncbi:MAG: hypothetical protein C4K47_01725 [Candidatus Thorarchaeota archaeon]|nr:MAG: hypothetical protein C4K47_01725 [Candidatus Thorarchaeota archaeon]
MVSVREIKGQQVRPFVVLALLVGSIALLWSSTFFVQIRSDSGSFWASDGYNHVEVELNSTTPGVNVTIETVRLHIPHFNVSAGNASILVRAANGTVLSNMSFVSGEFIPGVMSQESIPDYGYPVQTFTIALYWEGANNTVTFDYEEYIVAVWDGVPYAVILPGFYERLCTGLCLLAASILLFAFTTWVYNSLTFSGMRLPEYVLLISGFLLPTLLGFFVFGTNIVFRLYSSLWYYSTGTSAFATRISSTIELFPNAFALAGLPFNALLCLGIWLSSKGRISKRGYELVLGFSFLPQILALCADLYQLIVPYSPATYYVPIPFLQVAAYRLWSSWAPTEPEKGMLLRPERVLALGSLLAVAAPVQFYIYSDWWSSYWELSAYWWTYGNGGYYAGLVLVSSAYQIGVSLLFILVRLFFAFVLYRYCQGSMNFTLVLLTGIVAEMPYLAVDIFYILQFSLYHAVGYSGLPTPLLLCFGLIIAAYQRRFPQNHVAKSAPWMAALR